MEEERICTRCGEVLADYEGTTVDDDLLCDDCVDELCTTCDHCEEVIWTEDCVTDGDTYLCRECFSDYYRRCENCDNIIHDDSVCWHNDLAYCCDCFDDIDYDDEIEDYNYKPEPIFYGDSYMYFGVELEVDKGGKDGENARTLKDIANVHNDHIYIKSDGSLNDGFEIVSHPMTLDYHMNTMDWESVLHEAVNMDYRSHQTDTCGLHIHVNRDAFGENQSKQEEVIAKILFFIEKHWAEMFRFSRRSEYNMNRWSARYGLEKTGKEILEKAKESGYGRYVAVNLRNYSTIEFRLFRGTLKLNTFLATLQLVNEICRVALLFSEEEIEKMSWSVFVRDMTPYPELVQYLKERQLYINEEIFAEEEM